MIKRQISADTNIRNPKKNSATKKNYILRKIALKFPKLTSIFYLYSILEEAKRAAHDCYNF